MVARARCLLYTVPLTTVYPLTVCRYRVGWSLSWKPKMPKYDSDPLTQCPRAPFLVQGTKWNQVDPSEPASNRFSRTRARCARRRCRRTSLRASGTRAPRPCPDARRWAEEAAEGRRASSSTHSPNWMYGRGQDTVASTVRYSTHRAGDGTLKNRVLLLESIPK